ncbi:MAG: DUF1217 domain-containing protein [Henriciella sp.]|jgi:hypothetical protein
MFQPIITSSGIGGWNFLQSTYSRQFETFSGTPAVKNDLAYMESKLSQPMTQDEFLNDRRLLRVTMTAVGLEGEEWKRGFIDKVLTESADPESSFLARLNNRAYTDFAELFQPRDGMVSVSRDQIQDVTTKYQRAAFESAVGEVDNSMRLSLNYETNIGSLATEGTRSDTILFRILGDIPVRTVLGQALNIPESVQTLSLERQAEIFTERLSNAGIRNPQDLSSRESIDKIIRRYQAMESINQVSKVQTSSASIALTLLTNAVGFGSIANENLFRSNF